MVLEISQVSLLYSNDDLTQALNIYSLVRLDIYELLHIECNRKNAALALLSLVSTSVSASPFVVIVLPR